jgi:hypothetical protein
LDPQSFKACLLSTFESILEALRRAAAVHAVLEATLGEAKVYGETQLKLKEKAREAKQMKEEKGGRGEEGGEIAGKATSAGEGGGEGATAAVAAEEEGAVTENGGGGVGDGGRELGLGLGLIGGRGALRLLAGDHLEGNGDGEGGGGVVAFDGPLRPWDFPQVAGSGAGGGGGNGSNGSNNNGHHHHQSMGPSAEDLVGESLRGLREACELAQKTVSALLMNRKEVHTKLKVGELKELQSCSFEFLTSVEKVSGRSCYGLRSTLLAQAKAFLEQRQEQNLTNLAAALDSEKWTQAEVSFERQKGVDRLASGQAFLVTNENGGSSSSSSSSGGAGGAVTASSSSPPPAPLLR